MVKGIGATCGSSALAIVGIRVPNVVATGALVWIVGEEEGTSDPVGLTDVVGY